MMRAFLRLVAIPITALVLVHPAWAHTGFGSTAGFLAGFSHPLFGLDHALAMIAVGLWAAQLGGRTVCLMPIAFVCAMVCGGILGVNGLGLPGVELGIVGSILVLGSLIALNAKVPAVVGMVVVGLFAVFHGNAHGAEMPAAVSGATYGLGFAMATAVLHGMGIGLGLFVRNRLAGKVVRLFGGAIATTGMILAASI